MADWIIDNFDDEENPATIAPKECDYCGRKRLHWVKTAIGWRLADDKERIHSCNTRKKDSSGRADLDRFLDRGW